MHPRLTAPTLDPLFGAPSLAKDSRPSNRVLVVGNDDETRRVIEAIVQIEGCEVETASDGITALELAERWEPDLILLDMDLPDDGGLAFIWSYRTTASSWPSLVLFSGTPFTSERLVEFGADGLLPKPFAMTALLAMLDQFADCS